jgi:hypothetical protein
VYKHNIVGNSRPAGKANSVIVEVHSVMLILVWFLRVVAVLLAGWAAFWTYFALWFRLEGSSELEWIKGEDLKLAVRLPLL